MCCWYTSCRLNTNVPMESQIICDIAIALHCGRGLDEWLPDTRPLEDSAIVDIPREILNPSTADLAFENGEWKWDLFHELLLVDILLRIAIVPTPNHTIKEDCIGWKKQARITNSPSNLHMCCIACHLSIP
ncbi:hypothetical protein V6N13_089029 [Hibiscus sabdariffa]|uniref:Uncharacterized protein n=1 Tax=Hibiscus sabdariffa TaxID=183260 RepID=A0ABR2G1D8_9ROSI